MKKKVYKCLVASPGDTNPERAISEKIIDEINMGIGNKFEFIIEKRMWEHNTRPAFGEYSQAIVSDQLGSDYDVFIGIMNNKFGTETRKQDQEQKKNLIMHLTEYYKKKK